MGKTGKRVSAYMYDLANKDRREVGRLHEHSLGDNFTVVEGLSTQACFSQTACIDQLEHLVGDNKAENSVLIFSNITIVDIFVMCVSDRYTDTQTRLFL